MHAEQLTNPRSNVLTACPERSEGFKRSNAPTFNFQPKRSGANFVRPNLQPKTFVPQTTNQEHSPITSNYIRQHPFLANENGQKIFVPGKKFFKFFLLKNRGSILHLAFCIWHPASSAVDSQRSNAQTCKCLNASTLWPAELQKITFQPSNLPTFHSSRPISATNNRISTVTNQNLSVFSLFSDSVVRSSAP
jgi:hypothetical protein